MFGKFGSGLSLMALLLFGCAQPKYETAPAQNHTAGGRSEKVTNCSVRFQKSGLCVLWAWEKHPTESQTGTLVFKIVRGNLIDDSPIPVAVQGTAFVSLWMPDMGHGSSPTKTEAIDVGSFRVSEVFFVMPGQWQIKFQLREGDSVEDEAVANITF